MAKDIVLDEAAFEKAASDYSALAGRMNELKNDIEGMLENLRKGFDTPAGRKFDKACRNNLLQPIDRQMRVILHIQENLTLSKTEYQKVFDEYRQLNANINSYSQ